MCNFARNVFTNGSVIHFVRARYVGIHISMSDVLDGITAKVTLYFYDGRGLSIPRRLSVLAKKKKDAELTPNRRNVEKSSWAFAGYEVDYLRNDESYYDELCGIRERDSPTGTSHLCDILRINAENYNPR